MKPGVSLKPGTPIEEVYPLVFILPLFLECALLPSLRIKKLSVNFPWNTMLQIKLVSILHSLKVKTLLNWFWWWLLNQGLGDRSLCLKWCKRCNAISFVFYFYFYGGLSIILLVVFGFRYVSWIFWFQVRELRKKYPSLDIEVCPLTMANCY